MGGGWVGQPITDPTSGSSFDFDFDPDPDPELDNKQTNIVAVIYTAILIYASSFHLL